MSTVSEPAESARVRVGPELVSPELAKQRLQVSGTTLDNFKFRYDIHF